MLLSIPFMPLGGFFKGSKPLRVALPLSVALFLVFLLELLALLILVLFHVLAAFDLKRLMPGRKSVIAQLIFRINE